MSPVIEFQEVTKSYYGNRALSSVSFQVADGEVCGFLGPNGAGKTTCIGIIMGFLFPDSGGARVFGYLPGDVRANANIGFLSEDYAFPKHMTAGQLLRFHLTLSGLKPTSAAWIEEVLARVSLSGAENATVASLSRGMAQRLGIALALLGDPRLLILDEPTSGLDPAGRKEVLDVMASLKRAGKSVLFSSHILNDVEQICDRVIVIHGGRVAADGRLADLTSPDGRVEILIDQLPDAMKLHCAEMEVVVEESDRGVRLLVDASRKRKVEDWLREGGVDIAALGRVRTSLEDLFLKLTANSGERS